MQWKIILIPVTSFGKRESSCPAPDPKKLNEILLSDSTTFLISSMSALRLFSMTSAISLAKET